MKMLILALGFVLLSCSATPVAVTSPGPSVLPTATSVPTPIATASATTTVTGSVNWNHHPQSGVRVEISYTGAPWGCVGPNAIATTSTATDGTFRAAITPTPPNAPVGAFVCAFGVFLDGGRAASGSGGTLTTGSIDLARELTGLSIHNGDRVAAGPLTITWDAAPEATAYCVAVWRINTGYQGPSCLQTVGAAALGERITTTRFTTPPLQPDLYTISVVAITDVIVATGLNKPFSFTVTATQ